MKPKSAAAFILTLDALGAGRPAAPALAQGGEQPLFSRLSQKPTVRPEDTYSRGYAAGRSTALAEMEEKQQKQQTYYSEQLSIERYTWANREADVLAVRIDEGLTAIEVNLSSVVARILRPFLSRMATDRAIAELLATLETLLGADEGITLKISGREDLLQLIREKLSGRNITMLFTPNDASDVQVVAGQTILETNIGVWLKRVEERTE